MSKKILSAVLAIAMVVSLCASLFTVGASAATNYEADRAALKDAIKTLFVKGPSVSEDTIDFLTKAGILTVVYDCNGAAVTTEEEQARNKVFVVAEATCTKCGAGHKYIDNTGKYDGTDAGYFFKDEAKFDAKAYNAMIQEAATAYYFGQSADTLIVDASFNEGRNAEVKAQLKAINDYMADLKKEIGAKEDKPADYAKVYEAWKEADKGYNPNFGINPYGEAYSNADWYQILQNYNGHFFGWISFDTIKADSAKADLLNTFERLYRAAQVAKVEGVLFYEFVLGDKAKLEAAWNALIGSFKKEEIKWDLPEKDSVAAAIKEYNNMVEVLSFFEKYIKPYYTNVYAPADANLFANVALANGVVDFVKGQAVYIGAIGADYFKDLTNKILAGIAALNPAAANLAVTDADIAVAVALINEAQILYNAYATINEFAGDKKPYNVDWNNLKVAIDALKVIITYDSESLATYTVVANADTSKVVDINDKEVKDNDAIVIAFAPNYSMYIDLLFKLEGALEKHVANIAKYNAEVGGKFDPTGDGVVAAGPAAGKTSTDRANLAEVLKTYGFLVGELVSVKDGIATSDDAFKAIAEDYTAKFVAKIVLKGDNELNIQDDAACDQYEAFKDAFEAGYNANKNGKVGETDFAAAANAITALLPYLTANLSELINIYAYEAAVLADFFGIPGVIVGNVGAADYQNPANYLGYKTGTVKIAGVDSAVTIADILAIIAEYVDSDDTLDLVNGTAAIENEVVKAILAEINTVIGFYNEYVAGSYELPVIEITTQDVEDLITFYIENEDELKAAIADAYAQVEAALMTAIEAIDLNDPTTLQGYAAIALGVLRLYEGYTDTDVEVMAYATELLKYVDIDDPAKLQAILNGNVTFEAIKDLAWDAIEEVIDGYKSKLEAIDTPAALFEALVAANDLIDWYNANIAGEYTVEALELLPTDVYKVDATFDIDQIWEKLTANYGDIVIKELVRPGVDKNITVVAGGAYYDMMVNFFKLAALISGDNVPSVGYAPKYGTLVNAKALNDARDAFIASVKNLLTDDRGDELVDEFIADVISWVNTKYTAASNNTYELYEKLVAVFGDVDDCKALTLPVDAAEPYYYFNFTLKHIVEHNIPANKYNAANGMYAEMILDPLAKKSQALETIEASEVSQYDTEWTTLFKNLRTEAGYLYHKIDVPAEIPADITLSYVLGMIAKLDELLDTKADHHIDVLAAYKVAVLNPVIDAATGKNYYDYTQTDAGADIWANYEKAYAAAVAAKYDTRMPKSQIDAVVEKLTNALASLELVKKPDSAATIADLEAKINEAEALIVRADDLDTAVKVTRINELKAAIEASKNVIKDLKYVTNYNKFDIDAQIAKIQTAIDNVYASQTFADDLYAYVEFIYNAYLPFHESYTDASKNALVAAWGEALELSKNASLKASAYVAARAKVAAAYDALELKPAPVAPAMTKTFEAAVAKLAELKAVATEGFTAESVAAFNAAVAALQAGINDVAADDALLELIANAYIAKASLAAVVVENPTTCD